MCAGGVAPRPSSPRRRTPPDPTVGPFLVPALRTAPRRREFPAIYFVYPSRSAHCGPSAVSVTSMPASLSRSRIASASAQSRRALASSRRCTSACTRTSTAASAADVSSCDSQRSSSGSAAEDAHHRPDRHRVRQGRFVVTGVQRPVALGARGMHLGQRDRHRKVVVECRGELRRPLARHHRADPVAHPVQEVLDPGVGLGRILQRGLGELEHRPVMRAAQVIAQLGGPNPLQHSGNREHVAQRLAHLLAAHGDPAVVQPEPGERVARGLGLGDLVLVVREDQIHAAGVDVELGAEVRLAHRDALGVPAGAARAPRRRPRRLAGLRALPQREVALVALAGGDALALVDVVDLVAGQLAVVGQARERRSRRPRLRCRRALVRSAARSARPSA